MIEPFVKDAKEEAEESEKVRHLEIISNMEWDFIEDRNY